jgi:hypothetical protein
MEFLVGYFVGAIFFIVIYEITVVFPLKKQIKSLKQENKQISQSLDDSLLLLDQSNKALLANQDIIGKTQELIELTKQYQYVFCSKRRDG